MERISSVRSVAVRATLASTLASAAKRSVRREEPASPAMAAFEQVLLKLLNGFGGAHWAQIDAQIRQALRDIREFASADRCEFLEVGTGADEVTLIYRAGSGGTSTASAPMDYSAVTPWMFDKLVRRNEPVVFSAREVLPPEAAQDLPQLERTHTSAGLYIPCATDGVVRYVLGLAHSRARRNWPTPLVEQLSALARLLITALAARAMSAAHTQVQEQLAAAQQFSQATLDALHEHVVVVDAGGSVVQTSGSWGAGGSGPGNVFGEVNVGSNYLKACDAVRPLLRAQARRLARGIRSVLGGEVRRFDVDLVLPASAADDDPRWIRSKVRRAEVGGAVYAVICHDDVTEHRVREQELQQLRTHQWHSERVVQTGVIIGSLAHELSQPVTAILANAQTSLRLLGRGQLEAEENRQILTDIVADCKRAGSVIESLRITLRRQKTEHRSEDVSGIVQQVIRLLNTELIIQKVNVKVRCRPGCVALVDRAQLQQVLVNLVMNAIEAMPAQPGARRLWASVTRADGEVVIAIRDSGVGIPQEQLGKVFEAFWTTKARGTGMGLSICRAIVEAHGGRIWVKRNAVGSTFCVALPPDPAGTQAAAETIEAVSASERAQVQLPTDAAACGAAGSQAPRLTA
jgi:signal transduction histidine kinase